MRIDDTGNKKYIVDIDIGGNTVYDKVYEIEDVLMSHRKEIELGCLTEKSLSEIIRSITDYEKERFKECKRYLRNIYDVMIRAKYLNGSDLIEMVDIGRLVASIVILKSREIGNDERDFVNFRKACYEVYFEFAQNPLYEGILSLDVGSIEEELKPDHILDISSCLEYIKKWSTTANKKYKEMLNSKYWRFIDYGILKIAIL